MDKILVEVNNLYKSFGELEVLKGITEKISYGEVVSIIGPSGSGKSTFLRCLNLLEMPTDGEIIFKGKNLMDKNINLAKYRQKLEWFFNSSMSFHI